ncbi:unnamed protein product [Hanseniaspora opuntiae]
MRDFVKVTTIADEFLVRDDTSNLFTDDDLINSFDKIETIDYHSTIEISGIKITAYHAGHVLGAAMFQIDIGGINILFTGDYSRELDRHLNSAEIPNKKIDILIVESTFGTATQQPRKTREKRLTTLIHDTVKKGGRVLLPVFALGRAQEIMLILDEYWAENNDELGFGKVPIYYASDLAKKCLNVFQTYINMMNDNIRAKFRDSKSNPFNFKHISYLKNLENFRDLGPSVMLASPGMLQSGVSREILEKWFEEITFAAHVDFLENLDFIEKINAKNIILVHGESTPMGRLKSALLSKFKHLKRTDNEVKVYTPYNGVSVDIKFQRDKVATLVGTLFDEVTNKLSNESLNTNETQEQESDETEVETGIKVDGLLVNNTENFEIGLVAVDNIREFHSDLKTTIVKERQSLMIHCKKELIYWHITQMYNDIKILQDDENITHQIPEDEKVEKEKTVLKLEILKSLILTIEGNLATLEWSQSMLNDVLADSLMTILLSLDSMPVSVKMTHKEHSHGDVKVEENDEILPPKEEQLVENVKNMSRKEEEFIEKLTIVADLFKEQFGDSFQLHLPSDLFDLDTSDIKGILNVGSHKAIIDFKTFAIEECSSNALKGRIEALLSI